MCIHPNGSLYIVGNFLRRKIWCLYHRSSKFKHLYKVSLVLPLLKLSRRRSIFYCHFPDKLLCVDRTSILKKVYRFFLDYLEEFCMFFADLILVNSLYTKDIVEKAFPIYNKLSKNKPLVLYPAIDFNKFDNLPPLKLNH